MSVLFEYPNLKMFGVKLNKNDLCLKYLISHFKG